MPDMATNVKDALAKITALDALLEKQGGKATAQDVASMKEIRDLLSPAPAAATPAAPPPAAGTYPAPTPTAKADPLPAVPPAPHVWAQDLAAEVMADKAKGK